MDGKMINASNPGYGKNIPSDNPDLEAQATALGISYNGRTRTVSTDPRFDNELTKYENLIGNVGLPKDFSPEENYTLGEKVQVAISKWWNNEDSENYRESKTRIDDLVKKRAAKGEKKKRIRKINVSVKQYETIVKKCEDATDKYTREIDRIHKTKYVAQAKQAEQKKKYNSIDEQLTKLIGDYRQKQESFASGASEIDYMELVEAEKEINTMAADKDAAMSEKDHYTSVVTSNNKKEEIKTQAMTIASSAKTMHQDTLMKLKLKKDELASNNEDLTGVFGKPNDLVETITALKEAEEMTAQQKGAIDSAMKVAQEMQGIELEENKNNQSYENMSRKAEQKRIHDSMANENESMEKSRELLNARMKRYLPEDPSKVFGKKDDNSGKPGSAAA